MSAAVRLRNTRLGLSQEQLGAELNITFQQVQEYERNCNRINASHMRDISQILNFTVSYLFNDMSDMTMRSSLRRVAHGFNDGNAAGGEVKGPIARRDALELVRVYYTIKQLAVGKSVSNMVRSIATALTKD